MALTSTRIADRPVEVVRAKDAARLVDLGQAEAVLAAAAQLPDPLDDERLAIAVGHARLVTGDWHGALETFEKVAANLDPLPASLAWRMGLARYLRGEIEAADEIFERGRPGKGTTAKTPDESLLLSWTASVRWLRGAYDGARLLAERADEVARKSGDLRAVAGSQTVLTMIAAAAGDRCRADWHYVAARDAAERSGDVLTQIRLRVNRADHLTEQGLAAEAISELEAAFALSDRTGYVVHRAMALNNQGDAYSSLGEYDAAIDSYLAARDAFQEMGSRFVACPLRGLGLIYRLRGEVARARAAYEEAVQHAERVSKRDSLVAALAGLARVRAADDLTEATALADRAADLGSGPRHIEALLAQGWIARLRGDLDAAAKYADVAAQTARSRRDAAGLAEALELSACSGSSSACGELTDATELWSGLGNEIGAARSRLLAATLGVDRAPMTHAAGRRLRDLGVRLPWSGIADPLALVPVSHGVRIQALGIFRVLRHDVVVPVTEWQSKKARDLLKILVSRRGRSVTRDELIALLWPHDDSTKAPNRLSVLLSTLRSVLDLNRDESPVVSDRSTVRLDLDVVDVDVEHFAGLVTEALDAWQRRRGDAVTLLTQAEAAYGGDFCEEDVFEPWAAPLREELRSLHLSVVRALATASWQAGYTDGAVRWLLLMLRHDPYDESAHLELVRTLTQAGRHGDARRHYETYVGRMAELAIRPKPMPASS